MLLNQAHFRMSPGPLSYVSGVHLSLFAFVCLGKTLLGIEISDRFWERLTCRLRFLAYELPAFSSLPNAQFIAS